jgi:hypothetical protein
LLGGDEDTSRRYNYTESKEITYDTLNPNDANLDGIHDYHFGERVLSLRSLLKRYQTVTTYSDTTALNGAVLWAVNGNSIPWNASPVARGTIASEPTNPGEFRNNLYNYMRPAYGHERWFQIQGRSNDEWTDARWHVCARHDVRIDRSYANQHNARQYVSDGEWSPDFESVQDRRVSELPPHL